MDKVKLLITCVGGSTMKSLLSCLKQSVHFKYSLIGVDNLSAKNVQNLLDSFYIVPRGNNPSYVGEIIKIALREKVQFILPGSDEEALSISKNIDDFKNAGIQVIISQIDVLNLISNKVKTYKLLESNGLDVPEYDVINTFEGLKTSLVNFEYPKNTVIAKPSNGRGGRGMYVFEGEDNPPLWLGSGKREIKVKQEEYSDDLLKVVVQSECLVMPMLKSPAYDVDVMAIKGDANTIVIRERINPSGIPFQGNKILHNKKIEKYCRAIARVLNLDGLHDIDLMTDGNGNASIIEVNPRPSGSMAASLIAGFPILDIAILSLLKKKVPPIFIQNDITVLPDDDIMRVVNEKN